MINIIFIILESKYFFIDLLDIIYNKVTIIYH